MSKSEYYQDQIARIDPEHGVQFRLTNNITNGYDTKFMELNSESAFALMKFLNDNIEFKGPVYHILTMIKKMIDSNTKDLSQLGVDLEGKLSLEGGIEWLAELSRAIEEVFPEQFELFKKDFPDA